MAIAGAKQASVPAHRPVVALLGTPNSGKTTLFNALTGLSAKAGNYPGITVEHREGRLALGEGGEARLVDLPGTYSLVPRSDDEVVALEGLLGRLPGTGAPALILVVVDATNLERNLYLVAQLRELSLPLAVVLSMMDVVEADGRHLDLAELERRLGVPVVPSRAVQAGGVKETAGLVRRLLNGGVPVAAPLDAPVPPPPGPEEVSRQQALSEAVAERLGLGGSPPSLEAWAVSAAESGTLERFDPDGAIVRLLPAPVRRGVLIERIAAGRYARVGQWLAGVDRREPGAGRTRSDRATDRIDRIALHPVAGPLLLVLVFGTLFQGLFTWAEPLMAAIETAMGTLSRTVGEFMPEGLPLLRSLVVDGVIKGVGNVVVFVPQIALLFFFLGVLEESGYLARAAFLLDRLMSKVGLHGRAFVPMLSGFACAVPAIMATRTIENRKDRLVTILVTPLVSCSARLPIYGLMIATAFATAPPVLGVFQTGAVVMVSMYALSLVAALAMAALFKRTILKSPSPPFVLELPQYRWPQPGQLLRHVGSKVRSFLVEAGTMILAITVVLWGLFTFPRPTHLAAEQAEARAAVEASVSEGEERDGQLEAIDRVFAARRLEHSVAGRLGHAIEPALRPIGQDWKVGVGIVASFAAREVLVSTLGLAYGLGDDADEESPSLREAMRREQNPETGKPMHTPLSGLALMVFFVLAMQCMSTLAAVKRETRSWRWPAFQFAYMTALAYFGALVVFQGGRLLGLE